MRTFTKFALAILGVILLQMNFSAKSQVIFSESFTNGMPVTWTLYNVDNFVPASAVSYVNAAWIAREDFITPSDSCAFSTSWYVPAGVANDWMVSPAITIPSTGTFSLSWEGMSPDPSYRDGYQVRVANSASLTAHQAATPIYSTTAEQTTWTPHTVSLAPYAGQTIYISWRNNSNDKFILMIDEIEVSQQVNYDAYVNNLGELSEYTLIPVSQATPVPLTADVTNQGSMAITNVVLTVNVTNGLGATVYTSSSTATASIAPGATVSKTVPSWTPAAIGDYYVEYNVTLTEADAVPSNNIDTLEISFTDSTFARDNGVVSGVLGIGPGTVGELGQVFELSNAANLSSVSFFIGNGLYGMAGQPVHARVRAFNGQPGAILATTDTLIMDTSRNVLITLPISGGPLALPADSFFVGIVEGDSNLTLGYAGSNFVPGVTWIDFPGNPFGGWANNEDYGFTDVYVVRANIQPNCPAFTFTQTSTPATCGQNDGSASITVAGGTSPYTYLWTNGDTASSVSNLNTGTHTCTVTDAIGCSDTVQVMISNLNGPTMGTITIGDVDCNGNANGTASTAVTGGTPPYSYAWSNGATTSSVTGLPAGTYFVTVTDSAGCMVNGTASIAQPAALTASGSATDESCTGCADGTATVVASGGTSPYTYAWSNGSTTATVTGLSTGTYTVTVTDGNGCTSTETVTVGVMISNGQILNGTAMIQLFPNPSNGIFNLTIDLPEAENLTIEVMDFTGKIVVEEHADATRTFDQAFNLRGKLAPGAYLMRVTVGEAKYLRKLVIE